jgi:hypothetical protein
MKIHDGFFAAARRLTLAVDLWSLRIKRNNRLPGRGATT